MTQSTNRVGRIGEELAVRHLRADGYEILARNWRAAEEGVRGELDVVARRDGITVFCEVKARRHAVADTAYAAVTGCKQRRLRRLAALYLSRSRDSGDVRFDVVAVCWPAGGGLPAVEHIKGAF